MSINKKPRLIKLYIFRTLAVIVTVVTLLVVIIRCNIYWIKAYLSNSQNNHYKTGDKLYAREKYIINKWDVPLYHLARPLTEKDVDEMGIEPWKKSLIKQNLKPNRRPFLVETDWKINSDSLYKYKTAQIGSYVSSRVIESKIGDEFLYGCFYEISPQSKALQYSSAQTHKIPDGYKVIDSLHFYIPDYEVVKNHEYKFQNAANKK